MQKLKKREFRGISLSKSVPYKIRENTVVVCPWSILDLVLGSLTFSVGK